MSASAHTPRLSEDAAIVLALAGTAVTFAASPRDEADCWVRVMRLHGEVGCTLQALGVTAAPLESGAGSPAARGWRARTMGQDAADLVAARAYDACRTRGATLVRTVDVLAGVIWIYGTALDRAVERRGTSRVELLERLADPHAAPGAAGPDVAPPESRASLAGCVRRSRDALAGSARRRPRAARIRSTGAPRPRSAPRRRTRARRPTRPPGRPPR